METRLYGLLAETSIHPGTGQDAGLIDQPVAREATTDYPVMVGSAFKGAMRDKLFWQHFETKLGELSRQAGNQQQADAGQEGQDIAAEQPEQQGLADERMRELQDKASKAAEKQNVPLFGESESAGSILVSDVRLLLLPVRSLTSAYYWVTCQHLIERCERDLKRIGVTRPAIELPQLESTQFIGPAGNNMIHLEERQFERQGDLPPGLVELVKEFIGHSTTQGRVASQLVVLTNDAFAWFARYGLPVNARNQLKRETKSSNNLWYEETIPPDSVFYCLLAERNADSLQKLHSQLMQPPYIQVGGNETVGQGWMLLREVDPRSLSIAPKPPADSEETSHA